MMMYLSLNVPPCAMLALASGSFCFASALHAQDPCFHPDAATVYGVVRSESEVLVPGVSVLVTWDSGSAEVSSAADGSYRVCAIPYGTPILLVAAGGTSLSDPIELSLPDPGRYELDLTVRTIGSGRATGTSGIMGTALDLDTDEPIAGARISVLGGGAEALTSSGGSFRLEGLPPGERTLVLEHVTYGKREATVEVPPAATAVVRLRVPARPIALEPLEVVVEGTRVHSLEVRGFYERQRWAEAVGRGHFFTEADIRRRNPRLISHLIADVPGTILDCSGGPRSRTCELYFVGSRAMGSGCERANVYIDGARVIKSDNQLGEMLGVDELIAAVEIGGIEVYPSAASLPAEFSGSTGQCGAVVIWSK